MKIDREKFMRTAEENIKRELRLIEPTKGPEIAVNGKPLSPDLETVDVPEFPTSGNSLSPDLLDARGRLSRRRIIFGGIKRAAKGFLGTGVSILLATGDPVKALVGGVALGALGGASKAATEKLRADGRPLASAAANPIDTLLKIVLELIRAFRISLERRGEGKK